ncbi:hypothetical protein [Cryptosporangium japonicum]|uniref:Uncharacterized protein n=1 Tax=Cryptosporangium japonicum TaxID=80872 RepID=A0ABP3ENI4_9ACTN
MFFSGTAANALVRARSARHARDAWARLVDEKGERRAFAELASHAGGSDAAVHTLVRHGIETDLD